MGLTARGSVDANRPVLRWRERTELPKLGLVAVKAKVDARAHTPALHAFDIERFQRGSGTCVRLKVHQRRNGADDAVKCEVPLEESRTVRNSGGHEERRCVIETPMRPDDAEWLIDVTPAGTDDVRFRMLLGCTVLRQRVALDPARSHLAGKRKPKTSDKRNRS